MKFFIDKKIKGRMGRAGKIETKHGDIETPAFIIVGTKASVKALTPNQVRNTGGQAVLANTYHLLLQPGPDVVYESGGLHNFMRWDGPIMTDSGGFQAYSLGAAYGRGHSKFLSKYDVEKFLKKAPAEKKKARLALVNEGGVEFKSHLDGSMHKITPESSIEIQHALCADIMFAFDDFVTPTDFYLDHKEATERTNRWAERCLQEHKKLNRNKIKFSGHGSALFGIIQGGQYKELREKSAKIIRSMDFDGFGIGGSYTKEEMEQVILWTNPFLPEAKPRHLLGIGEPLQLFIAIEHGVDTFDCVAPTREARNGRIYTKNGTINITNARFIRNFDPLDEKCSCYACESGFSRAYLAHLFRAGELLAYTLSSIHNLYFFVQLVKNIRKSILEENFFEFKKSFCKKFYTAHKP